MPSKKACNEEDFVTLYYLVEIEFHFITDNNFQQIAFKYQDWYSLILKTNIETDKK